MQGLDPASVCRPSLTVSSSARSGLATMARSHRLGERRRGRGRRETRTSSSTMLGWRRCGGIPWGQTQPIVLPSACLPPPSPPSSLARAPCPAASRWQSTLPSCGWSVVWERAAWVCGLLLPSVGTHGPTSAAPRAPAATVYRGSYQGTAVAIKRLVTSGLPKRALQRFEKECEVMALLRSPHIVLLIGVVRHPPNLLLVSEFMALGDVMRCVPARRVTAEGCSRQRAAPCPQLLPLPPAAPGGAPRSPPPARCGARGTRHVRDARTLPAAPAPGPQVAQRCDVPYARLFRTPSTPRRSRAMHVPPLSVRLRGHAVQGRGLWSQPLEGCERDNDAVRVASMGACARRGACPPLGCASPLIHGGGGGRRRRNC